MQNDYDTIIVSSRIRLARNFSNVCFPHKLKDQSEASAVINSVFDALPEFENYKVCELDSKVLGSLKEKHLISEDLCKNREFGALSLSHDETISVMINEEEHIREQCILKGFSLDEALEKLYEIDDILLDKLPLSYDKQLGFLTTCPSNLGTGMRASVMLFLPALSLTNSIPKLIEDLKTKGLTVRGNYGEGSDANGYMFQISNSQTLGLTENDIIENVENAVIDICERELSSRKSILESKNIDIIKDRILRAYGILKYAHILKSDEAYSLISQVKFGVAIDLIYNLSFEMLNKLLEDIQPNTLAMIYDCDTTEENLNKLRAEYISSKI